MTPITSTFIANLSFGITGPQAPYEYAQEYTSACQSSMLFEALHSFDITDIYAFADI